MKAATVENAKASLKKADLYPCNSNIFRPHEFLVSKKDSEQASVEAPEEPQPGTYRDQVNINPVTPIDISPLPVLCKKR
jgi:hypothetical protein